MRLYKRHDLDLLCLYNCKGFSIQTAIKRAVLAAINQEQCVITCPSHTVVFCDMPSNVQFHLYLSKNNEDDVKIYNFIKSISVGYKNSVLKNITRKYLERPSLYKWTPGSMSCYFQSDDI